MPGDRAALVGVVPPPTAPAEGEYARQINDVFRRLYPRLISHAERLLDRESARDAVSQTFLELWLRWPQLTTEQRTDDRYFFRAVLHTSVDARKSADRFVSLADAEEEIDRKVVSEASTAWGRDSLGDVIDAAVEAMPAARREVFILTKEQGLTYKKAAEQLGLSVATINSQMLKAYADIRARFARDRITLTSGQTPRLPSTTGGATND
ncbi:MAG: sigma-70 family RNA polymerase sigma factor [Gemmatimonadaceae bacterium]|nr:sigma-70 family RNA polymerase sigma factor [Gemmatimonadaceae bacterium]